METPTNIKEYSKSLKNIPSRESLAQSFQSAPITRRDMKHRQGQDALSGALDNLSHLSLTDILKLREVLTRCDADALADAYVDAIALKPAALRVNTNSPSKERRPATPEQLPTPPQASPVHRIKRKAVPKPIQLTEQSLQTDETKPANVTNSSASLASSTLSAESIPTPQRNTATSNTFSPVSPLDADLDLLLERLEAGPLTPILMDTPRLESRVDSPVEEKFEESTDLTATPFHSYIPPTIPRASVANSELMSLYPMPDDDESLPEVPSKVHESIDSDKALTCPETYCEEIFTRSSDLARHLQSSHEHFTLYTCPHKKGKVNCSFTTFDVTSWDAHHKSRHVSITTTAHHDPAYCRRSEQVPRKVWACGLCYQQRFPNSQSYAKHYARHIRLEGKSKQNMSFSMKMMNLLGQDGVAETWNKMSAKTTKDDKFWIGWNDKKLETQDLMKALECGIFNSRDLTTALDTGDLTGVKEVVKTAVQLGKHPRSKNVRASKYPVKPANLQPFPTHLVAQIRDRSTG